MCISEEQAFLSNRPKTHFSFQIKKKHNMYFLEEKIKYTVTYEE